MESGFSDAVSKGTRTRAIAAQRDVPTPSTTGFIIKIIIAEDQS